MGSHEYYEETKLYPYLTRRFDMNCEPLTKEHQEMHTHRDKCLRLFTQLESSKSDVPDSIALIEALIEYDKVLRVHLMEEEELVIPALLMMDQQEFQDFIDLDLTQLFRRLDKIDKQSGVKRRK